jgi:hypothetical protein
MSKQFLILVNMRSYVAGFIFLALLTFSPMAYAGENCGSSASEGASLYKNATSDWWPDFVTSLTVSVVIPGGGFSAAFCAATQGRAYFGDACATHDACYDGKVGLGMTREDCDASLHNQWRKSCQDQYEPANSLDFGQKFCQDYCKNTADSMHAVLSASSNDAWDAAKNEREKNISTAINAIYSNIFGRNATSEEMMLARYYLSNTKSVEGLREKVKQEYLDKAALTPVCTLTANPSNILAGSSSTLTASCTPAATSYAWSDSTCDKTKNTCTVTPTTATTYTVTGTNTSGTSTDSRATVTIAKAPICILIASPALYAEGDSVTLTAHCNPAVTSYVWSGGTCTGTTAATCSVTAFAKTSYTVTGSNAAGSGSGSITMTVTPPPTGLQPSADGTVTDPKTGLTWMRCSMGQTWDGNTCIGTASTYTFDGANALTGRVTFAGKNDWRLPNIRELQSIVNRSATDPSIDSFVFPNTWRADVRSNTPYVYDS